jgi:beta-N-acetylhexosaminidase
LDVVGSAQHRLLADEIACHSITLVRDETNQLPLKPDSGSRLAVIVPQPQDLTPADTSSYEKPALAEALRAYHPNVDEFVIPLDPTPSDVAALTAKAGDYAAVIIATLNATSYLGQPALVQAMLARNPNVIVAALRMPYDLQAFANIPTYLCTYSLQPSSLQALAKGLFGQMPFVGVLPVAIQPNQP